MSAPADARTTIAVLTFRRPGPLRALLPELVAQAAQASPRWGPVRILVVDNDPGAGGSPVVAEVARRGPGGPTLEYAHEPAPGIAAARNRALAESAASEFLVFIDDDELPADGWLAALLETREATGAVAVAGTVTSHFAVPLPAWVAAGGFFERRRLPTGTPIDIAATNNLALHLPAVRASGLRFDPRFGLSGGEDTLFTRQLVAAGQRMVWCAEAVVTDVVPPERASRQWVVRRAFSSGNSATRVDLALAATWSGRLGARTRGWSRGSIRVLGGTLRWLLGVVAADIGHRARGVHSLARGAGMLAGTVGQVYEEYRPHHG